MDNARTTSNRLRTENQELKTETKELKKELGKMKDLFNSEQLEALRHHFPNISKAMEEERPTQANHQKQRFQHGYVTPRPQRGATKQQLHSMECYAVRVRKKFCRVRKTVVCLFEKSLWCGRSSGRVVPPLAAGRSPTDDFFK